MDWPASWCCVNVSSLQRFPTWPWHVVAQESGYLSVRTLVLRTWWWPVHIENLMTCDMSELVFEVAGSGSIFVLSQMMVLSSSLSSLCCCCYASVVRRSRSTLSSVADGVAPSWYGKCPSMPTTQEEFDESLSSQTFGQCTMFLADVAVSTKPCWALVRGISWRSSPEIGVNHL